MKESSYNHFIDNGDSVVCFNAFKNSYMLINKALYKEFETHKNDFEKLANTNKKFYKTLISNGFIAPENLNERDSFISNRLDRRFSGKSYHVILNMTMECNLRCWYCYEEHKTESNVREEIVEALFKHLEKKLKTNPFENLVFSFFGGEPLLQKEKILGILDRLRIMSNQWKFTLNVNFTTNGTLIDIDFLNSLKDLNVGFQITLDGNRNTHNQIRKYKDSLSSSFDRIIHSLKLIDELLENYQIALRINVSPKTTDGILQLLPQITNVLNPKKSRINIYKVWQVDAKMIDENVINKFVEACQSQGFVCGYLNLDYCTSSCYADNYSQIVINYDGLVYKCTARKFNKNNSCGYLNSDGTIVWDFSKLINRMAVTLPERCLNCNILPVCPKPCSQAIIENDDIPCILNNYFAKEDYIIQTFNNKLIKKAYGM